MWVVRYKRGYEMTTAREIMHPGAECIKENETLATAASRMRELQVGALPICGADDRLRGILTDRDIVVRAIAHGRDPHTTTVRELAQGTPIWVDANATVDEAIQKMVENKVRRLPVIDDHRLVGMISEADLARNCSQQEVAQFAVAVYTAPPTRL
jgi:CBS domain-containing protein